MTTYATYKPKHEPDERYRVERIDYDTASALRNRAARDGVSAKQSRNTQWFGAFFETGDMIGLMAVMDMGGRARLKALWVDPEHRRRGVRDLLAMEAMNYIENELFSSEINGWTRDLVEYWGRWGLTTNGKKLPNGAWWISKTV